MLTLSAVKEMLLRTLFSLSSVQDRDTESNLTAGPGEDGEEGEGAAGGASSSGNSSSFCGEREKLATSQDPGGSMGAGQAAAKETELYTYM